MNQETEYEEQCRTVLESQAKRVAIMENHSPLCECEGCPAERADRRLMESMPEHKENQRAWVDFMKAGGSVNEAEVMEEISEFNFVPPVTF